jgi:ADP-ribosylglycohydrolase
LKLAQGNNKMLYYSTASQQKLNLASYRDKVLGCWTGKNIGGTLGAPFEWKQDMQNVSFYTQDLQGCPEPNDDLDLQLVWLFAAETHGVCNLTERLLAEYWMQTIIGPWNEYAVCRANIRNGLYPPLSGSCNNDRWKNSNGAWIRSEIWACIFPGEPDMAVQFAYMDACIDHAGDGIYAEMFTAALESAAFIINDIRQIIDIGLSKIPEDSRIARSVKLACALYDKKTAFADARNAIVKDNEDLGWFQAPANIGFVVLGLLYGGGDFGKSICCAVNCGDDTDCTGATVGSILGIMQGRNGIPKKWTEPIGERIQTVAIDPVDARRQMPKTLDELTERVIRLAVSVQYKNPDLLQIIDKQTHISKNYISKCYSSELVKKRLWTRSPYELAFDLPLGILKVDYENGPEVLPGESKNIRLSFVTSIVNNKSVNLKWLPPEGWQVLPSKEVCVNCIRYREAGIVQTIIPGNFDEAYFYLPLELKLVDRNTRINLNIPFQKQGSVNFNPDEVS